MEEQNLWQAFMCTGTIDDYLKYNEKKSSEQDDKDKGAYNQGSQISGLRQDAYGDDA